jgi:hypothetical protein
MNLKEHVLLSFFDKSEKYQFNCFRNPKNKELVEKVISETVFLKEDAPFSQRIWHVVKDIYTPVLCSEGNEVSFRSYNEGYRERCTNKFCSCWSEWRKLQSKKMYNTNKSGAIQEALISKYGVTSASKIDFVKKKISDSNKKVKDRALKRRKETMLSRYGVEYSLQSDDIRSKIVTTNLERYGVDNAMKSQDIRAKSIATNLERYGVDNVMKSQDIRAKAAATNLERYGVDNPLKSEEIRAKVANTNLERYGVDNPLKSEEIRAKAAATNLERYGNEYSSKNQEISSKIKSSVYSTYHPDKELTEEEILEIYSTLNSKVWWETNSRLDIDIFLNKFFSSPRTRYMHIKRNRPDLLEEWGTISLPHQKIIDILIFNNIEHEVNNRSIISPKELDIYIPHKKLAIEINGLYWHSEISGGKDRNYHLNKTKQCAEQGIRLLHFTDEEINNPIKFNIVQSMIKAILSIIPNKLGARSCQLVFDLDKEIIHNFLNESHIQGTCTFSSSISLLHPDHGIVAVMTYGKPRYNKEHDIEILRFAVKPNYSIIGGFSKILSYLPNNIKIVSYASKNYSIGNVYLKNGFIQVSESGPNYFYIAPEFTKLESRVKYQKHKLNKILEQFDPDKTEWENMIENGYDRIWDCGNLVFSKS